MFFCFSRHFFLPSFETNQNQTAPTPNKMQTRSGQKQRLRTHLYFRQRFIIFTLICTSDRVLSFLPSFVLQTEFYHFYACLYFRQSFIISTLVCTADRVLSFLRLFVLQTEFYHFYPRLYFWTRQSLSFLPSFVLQTESDHFYPHLYFRQNFIVSSLICTSDRVLSFLPSFVLLDQTEFYHV